MKTLRVCLLLLLALLLPVRGAVAVALSWVPSGAEPAFAAAIAGMTAMAAPAAHAATGMHCDAAATDHGHAGPAAPGGGCHLCAAFCSMLPLAGTLPVLPPPAAGGTVAFPAPLAPALSFQPDGLERPPRRV